MKSLLWDRDGEIQELDPYPESFGHWEVGQPLDETQSNVLRRVEAALSLKIVEFEVRGEYRNLVLEITFDNGVRGILRTQRLQFLSGEARSLSEVVQVLRREIAIQRWLKSNTTLPVPDIRRVVEPRNSTEATIIVMEKLPGEMLFNTFGGSTYAVKERVMLEMADVQLQLYKLDMPQRIGTLQVGDGDLGVAPYVRKGRYDPAPQVYDTLEDYLTYVIETGRLSLAEADEDIRTLGLRVLNRIAAALPAIYARLNRNVHRRCVLTHADLNAANILVDAAGRITGVLDWEYQFKDPTHQVWTSWHCSPDDAEKLRAVYAEAIKSKDRECWEALVDGELLRQLVEWVQAGRFYPLMEQWVEAVLQGL
ncbi:kinase-like protein [Trametes coccinea BRFM310]|uniref:Kinase-like protein n=1 Tax=Trametes coccinea (strain BRFM310) TaxID=1353009 RepID=A0A1Y2J1L9_TRAC3|nr:kinase-like protein [Trametes coccinea BRFM310]